MKTNITLGLMTIALVFNQTAAGQGCVAVRPMSCAAAGQTSSIGMLSAGDWQVSAAYRYFKSYKHFRGDSEETDRVEENTQVINIGHSVDFALNHAITNRFGISFTLPVISYDRSSLYEHYGNDPAANPTGARFHTNSFGFGDVRVTSNYWLFDPAKPARKGNLSIGLGVKMPTGEEGVLDEFHKLSSTGEDYTIIKPVDQSIQLGDGGWGFNLEGQGFQKVFRGGWFYYNGFYLFNPRQMNNVLRSGKASNPFTDYFSVTDQYGGRLGLNCQITSGFMAGLGARIEGVPAYDLIGGSLGYRRPGYVVSAEPSIIYSSGKANLTLNLPLSLYRNRIKSFYDRQDPLGLRHGDAAFADYVVNLTFAYKLNGKKQMDMTAPDHITESR